MTNPKFFAGELLAALAVVLAIGWLDYRTGDELDLFVLYFLPILALAWRHGFRACWGTIAVASVSWTGANVLLGHAYSVAWMGWWGGVVMLAMFLAAGWAAARIRSDFERERALNRALQVAMAKIKRLTGRLPICMSCKSIQDESGRWQEIEAYLMHQSDDDFIFSHTVCPHCRPGVRENEFSTAETTRS